MEDNALHSAIVEHHRDAGRSLSRYGGEATGLCKSLGAAEQSGAKDLWSRADLLMRLENPQLVLYAMPLIHAGQQISNFPETALGHGNDRGTRAAQADAQQILMLKLEGLR